MAFRGRIIHGRLEKIAHHHKKSVPTPKNHLGLIFEL
jgi:hypothetical protein